MASRPTDVVARRAPPAYKPLCGRIWSLSRQMFGHIAEGRHADARIFLRELSSLVDKKEEIEKTYAGYVFCFSRGPEDQGRIPRSREGDLTGGLLVAWCEVQTRLGNKQEWKDVLMHRLGFDNHRCAELLFGKEYLADAKRIIEHEKLKCAPGNDCEEYYALFKRR